MHMVRFILGWIRYCFLANLFLSNKVNSDGFVFLGVFFGTSELEVNCPAKQPEKIKSKHERWQEIWQQAKLQFQKKNSF